jgi:hypothetical protein
MLATVRHVIVPEAGGDFALGMILPDPHPLLFYLYTLQF